MRKPLLLYKTLTNIILRKDEVQQLIIECIFKRGEKSKSPWLNIVATINQDDQ